jgi:hypothetical protein
MENPREDAQRNRALDWENFYFRGDLAGGWSTSFSLSAVAYRPSGTGFSLVPSVSVISAIISCSDSNLATRSMPNR